MKETRPSVYIFCNILLDENVQDMLYRMWRKIVHNKSTEIGLYTTHSGRKSLVLNC